MYIVFINDDLNNHRNPRSKNTDDFFKKLLN